MVTRYHSFVIVFLLFVWVLFYTHSISGDVRLDGAKGDGNGNGNGKERENLISSPSKLGSEDKNDDEKASGVRHVGVGSAAVRGKERKGSRLGKLVEMGMGRGLSVPGDASPHEQKVLKEKEEKEKLRKEKEKEEKKAQEEKEEQDRIAKQEEEEGKENEEDVEEEVDEEEGIENEETEEQNETEDAANEKVVDEHKPLTLRSLCETTAFQPGLYLHCHSWCGPESTSICGGLNNARNRVQTCLRLALDLGSNIILPTVSTGRHRENPSLFSSDSVCPDVYFDISYLTQEMGSVCPKLEMRRCGDTSGIAEERIIQMGQRQYMEGNYHIRTFKSTVDEHLESLSLSEISSENPVAVGFGDTMFAYNYTYASEQALQQELFRTIKYNPELLHLGSQIRDTPQLRDGYIAVHLRGEADWPPHFGSRDQQMDFYTEEIEHASAADGIAQGIKNIYVSCGDSDAISLFRERLSPLGFQVYDKWELVSALPDLLKKLVDMEFDAAAIVEYPVLVEAGLFLGVWMSTFSQTIAYARAAEDEDDFWETYITPGSSRNDIGGRDWDNVPALKGDEKTKLLVVNTGDISDMDAYP
ncbi:b0ea89d9-77fc-4b52-9413-3fa6e162ea98 [Sclerotinia trifoliorum]|uniref:B0ea89d9-77fc-4b52-9413-3fa6e162ea98 n=1 Tax=Sclerotinia trifoliorum TaxID=28548 RepID=A0A8H2ZNH3_9HELO|nr:b0ea89d9-77fc-4b52-9413-3fa6e162ea98 [Sclerotinia trifoliorum]